MDVSRKISTRLWNQPFMGELESRREDEFIDDIVLKDHTQRALLANLEGVETVFDGGAGAGRFSVLLARRGIRVTHFDISRPMIEKARELAAGAGVEDHITFVEGALEDISAFGDGAFDMVISFDAPISYTYPNQQRVIGELVRIARDKIMVSVSSRLGSLPYMANPLQKNQFILDEESSNGWIRWCVDNRDRLAEEFRFDGEASREMLHRGLTGDEETIRAYEEGGTPWPVTYHFLPDELVSILGGCGVGNIRLAGPGAYARTVPREILVRIMADPEQRRDFLDFCYEYDGNPYVCGLGKDNLLAWGDVGVAPRKDE